MVIELLMLERLTEVVDIGASSLDGTDPPYQQMLQSGMCNVTGFEPYSDAFLKLQEHKTIHERYLPYAILDGTTQNLNIHHVSGMNSTLNLDPLALDVFEAFKHFGKVIKKTPIETFRLDDVKELDNIDFLKMDIQGGELKVLKNGVNKLSNCAVIQTEISFIQLYENQPTFGEIDAELRSQGFIPHCFADIKKWIISPLVLNNNPRIALNQLLEGDMVYVKNFLHPESITDEQLKHLCLVMHFCYESYDLALRCVALLSKRGVLAKESVQTYVRLLQDRLKKST